MSIDLSNHNIKKKKSEKNKQTFSFSPILSNTKYSDKKKEAFYKEFAILINSGVDFEQCLSILEKQQTDKTDKALLVSLKQDVVRGKSLFEAMKSSNVFSSYEYFSVKIGEETRSLELVFKELQSFYSRKIKMKRQLISVFTYPFFVLLITGGVLYFMLSNVVPMFTSVFKQFGGELPALTKKIIILSDNLPYITVVLIGVVILFVVLHFFYSKNDNYRKMTSNLLLKIPLFGGLIQKIYLARFSQSLSLLLGAKTPLVDSLELTEKMITFYPMEKSIAQIRKDILRGSTFALAMEKHTIYNHKIVSMVKVGEEINKLDQMFDTLTKQYNDEIEHQTKMIGVILEPLIIIIIGLVVGVIMVAMYSPMFDLSKILGRH